MKPIIFSGEMIKATLDGPKSQTRRPIKPQPPKRANEVLGSYDHLCADRVTDNKDAKHYGEWALYGRGMNGTFKPVSPFFKPKYQPGDKLWVREAWRIHSFPVDDPMVVGYKDGLTMEERGEDFIPDWQKYELWDEKMRIQSFDELEKLNIPEGEEINDIKNNGEEGYTWSRGFSPLRWRPSIHMPRWASRLTLEVLSVRAEGLQEISNEDCVREGACKKEIMDVLTGIDAVRGSLFVGAMKILWDSIYAKKPEYQWDANPWVWVYEFKAIYSEGAER